MHDDNIISEIFKTLAVSEGILATIGFYCWSIYLLIVIVSFFMK
jgi:hypothetical protein